MANKFKFSGFSLAILLLLGYIPCLAQNSLEIALLDSFASETVLFIHKKPVPSYLDLSQIKDYQFSINIIQNVKLDTSLIRELILNSTPADTSRWRDDELSNKIFVSSFNEFIDKKSALKKFHFNDKKKEKKYKKYIRMFNAADEQDKTICFMSRPVYDKTRQFAIITQYSRCGGNLCGDGCALLYHLENNTWRKVCWVYNWVS